MVGLQPLAQQLGAAAVVGVGEPAILRRGPVDVGQLRQRRDPQLVLGLIARRGQVGQPVLAYGHAKHGGEDRVEHGELIDVAVRNVADRPGS